MTLLWFDGFDMGDQAIRGYALTQGNVSSTTRFGVGRSIAGTASGFTIISKSIAPVTKVIVGQAVRLGTGDNSANLFSFFGDGGLTNHINVRAMSNGSVAVFRGSTQVAVAAGFSVVLNVWNYWEVSATISDTVGVVKVRYNGVEVLSFTGDTRNAGTANTIDQVRLDCIGTNASFHDDLYICDDTGPAPWNDFLGDVRVVTLSPTAPGNSTGLTPSVAPNWGCVDEQPYSATDFVSSSTVGAKDTYACADLPPGTATVYGVLLNTIAKKSDAGTRNLKNVVRVGGTDYSDSSVQPMATSDNSYRTLRTQNPNGNVNWTPAAVNGMEIGVEVA